MVSIDDLAVEFQIYHQNIYDLYFSQDTDKDKWHKIAVFMNDNDNLLVDIFDLIKNNDERKNINLDYDLKLKDLYQMISEESDSLRKISLIILSLHQMIYHLMTIDGNYYFKLLGRDEMAVIKNDLTYYINMSIQNSDNIYFYAFILLYALESLFNSHFYVGVDFEYTKRKIQLAQLNFEHHQDLRSMIMIVSPRELEDRVMNNFIKLIMCNSFIKKILHGSDSLDIPYVYNNMLAEDPEKIIDFTKTMIDTKILCDYYKENHEEVHDNSCAIYDIEPADSAIYFFRVVSLEQQDKLSAMLESLPPPYDIQWNIHKMPQSQVLYAQYDVLFLKYFFYRMIYCGTKQDKTESEKKETIELYKHIIPELTQFVYLENNKITFLKSKCKEEVDVVNNYFIKKPKGIVKMIDVYNQLLPGLSTTSPVVDIDKIIKVNYLKTAVKIIIKRIVYGHLSRKCRIYKDKNTLWTDKLSNKFIIDFFKELQFNYLLPMFKELNQILENKVSLVC